MREGGGSRCASCRSLCIGQTGKQLAGLPRTEGNNEGRRDNQSQYCNEQNISQSEQNTRIDTDPAAEETTFQPSLTAEFCLRSGARAAATPHSGGRSGLNIIKSGPRNLFHFSQIVAIQINPRICIYSDETVSQPLSGHNQQLQCIPAHTTTNPPPADHRPTPPA